MGCGCSDRRLSVGQYLPVLEVGDVRSAARGTLNNCCLSRFGWMRASFGDLFGEWRRLSRDNPGLRSRVVAHALRHNCRHPASGRSVHRGHTRPAAHRRGATAGRTPKEWDGRAAAVAVAGDNPGYAARLRVAMRAPSRMTTPPPITSTSSGTSQSSTAAIGPQGREHGGIANWLTPTLHQ